jgi:predicted enzyme related to lactoylglutathione lyase
VQAKEIPGSMNYVRVDDLDAASQKIVRAGGEIVLPRVDIPGMGSFFWFRVPGGPILAAWQDAAELPKERD